MPGDLTMCTNEECPSHGSCYRFIAIPDPHYQQHAIFQWTRDTGKCDYYELATCCEQSQYQWGTGERDGELRACLYCAKDYDWSSGLGRWRRTGV